MVGHRIDGKPFPDASGGTLPVFDPVGRPPSARDPSASVLLAEAATPAGVPPGVFKTRRGDATTVRALLENPRVVARADGLGAPPQRMKLK